MKRPLLGLATISASAGTGSVYMTGFNAAIDDINANGGAAGRPFEVNLIDDKSDIKFAVSTLTELLKSGDGADVIVPGGVSTEALAMLPLTTDYDLFSVSPASSALANDPVAYPNHFGISVLQAAQLDALGAAMADQGIETLGVMVGADAFGDGNLTGIQAVAEKYDIEIVATERPDPTAPSVPATLSDEAALESCVLPSFSAMVTQDDPPAYLQTLLDAFEGSDVSAYAGGLGFDTVRLLALAIERADGDTSAAALTEALRSEPIPADYLALYPDGFEFSNDNHFPTPAASTFTPVPCSAGQVDGLWVTTDLIGDLPRYCLNDRGAR